MKRPKDMTPEERAALPEHGLFTYDEYIVPADGTVTLPDGRVLEGLRGTTLRVPRAQEQCCACWHGPDDLMMWRDADGEAWAPVQIDLGWAKRRLYV